MNDLNKNESRLGWFLDPLRRHRWLTVLGSFLSLSLLFIFFALPPIIRWGMEKWLESHGRLDAEVEEVDFNLFSGNMVVHSLLTERNKDGGMRWGRASLEFNWRPVFSKRIRLDDIRLVNARIDIERESDGALYVGGFRMLEGDDAPSLAEKQVAGDGWEIGLGTIELRHVTLRYIDPAGTKREVVVQNLHTDAIQSWNPSRSSRFSASITLAGGSLAVGGSVRPFGRNPGAQGNLKFRNVSLQWIASLVDNATVETLTGTLTADTRFDVSRGRGAKNNPMAELDGEMVLNNLGIDLPGAELDPTTLKWNGTLQLAVSDVTGKGSRLTAKGRIAADGPVLHLSSGKLSVTADTVEIEGDFSKTFKGAESNGVGFDGAASLEGVRVKPMDGRASLARAGRIALQAVTLSGSGRIGTAEATITDLDLLERLGNPPEEFSPMLRLPSVAVNGVAIDRRAKRLSVEAVRITDASAVVIRDPTGRLEMVRPIPGTELRMQPPGDRPTATPWAWRVGRTELRGNSRLKYRDTSVDPMVDVDFSKIIMTVLNLDSAAHERQSSLRLEAEVGNHASFRLHGDIRPFAQAISMDMNGEVKRFSLPKIRAYTERMWGYSIRSGQLYADFHLLAENTRLDSEIKLFITSLSLDRQRAEELDEITQQLGMPLNSALNLLRDGEGSIRLTLPVTGSFSKPDIGLGDIAATAVRKATYQAIKTAALSYFAPLGAAYVATKMLGKMTALRLEPVYFSPGESRIDPEDRSYLRQVADKIKDRPETRMVICGIAVPQDRRALGQELDHRAAPSSDRQQNTDRGDIIAVPDVSAQRLLDLADNRSEAVRTFLVSEGVDAGRLAVCAPDVDEGKDRPQAELAL